MNNDKIARKKVSELKKIIEELGVVNIGAIDEYERIKTRYEFLNNQKNDLYKAENTLLEIIKEMDSVMSSELMSVGKAAELLAVSPQTLRRWARQGRVSCVRLPSGHRRFRREDVLPLLSSAEERAEQVYERRSA